jgi:hypothetical protein
VVQKVLRALAFGVKIIGGSSKVSDVKTFFRRESFGHSSERRLNQPRPNLPTSRRNLLRTKALRAVLPPPDGDDRAARIL